MDRNRLYSIGSFRLSACVLGAAMTLALFSDGQSSLFVVESSNDTFVEAIDPEGRSAPNRYALSSLPTGSPLEGQWRVSQSFGGHANPITGKTFFHTGIDLTDGRSGDPVRSTIAGKVVAAGFDESMGNYVVVARGDLEVRFLKLERFRVEVGDRVSRGTVVGSVGRTGLATGPHLHYEVRADGSAIDPGPLLKAGGARFQGL